MVDLASVVAEAVSAGASRENAFETWLTENEEAGKLFWGVMRDAYVRKGVPFAHCMKAWKKHFPDAPPRTDQTVKKMVDNRLADS